MKTIAAALAATFAIAAHATDGAPPPTAAAAASAAQTTTQTATTTASPTASATGSTGAVRTIAIGTSSAANNNTCQMPWALGLFVWTDNGCSVRRDIATLNDIGMKNAALQRACRDPEMYAAISKSDDAWKCQTQPDTLTGEYR